MNSKKPHILTEITADGSCTLFVPAMDEHYHSVKGAYTESRHIFIDMGFKQLTLQSLKVLEIGFGTGLNAFLTLLVAEETKAQVHYTGIELYPLSENVIDKLGYPEVINPLRSDDFYRLHSSSWDCDEMITSYFTLTKIEADFTAYCFPDEAFDLIYFDAFAPEKQPEMWTQELFNHLYTSLKPGGLLTTYCAKGMVRRALQSSGFTVERLPGPPQGKREILRARK